MTHRQEEAWLEWFDSRDTTPDQQCFYIAQLTDVVANVLNTEEVRIDANKWKMKFDKVAVSPPETPQDEAEPTQEDLDEQTRKITFTLIGMLGAGSVKGIERLERKKKPN